VSDSILCRIGRYSFWLPQLAVVSVANEIRKEGGAEWRMLNRGAGNILYLGAADDEEIACAEVASRAYIPMIWLIPTLVGAGSVLGTSPPNPAFYIGAATHFIGFALWWTAVEFADEQLEVTAVE